MAVLYVRSTDGNDADNGTTWALAKATLAGALAIAAAGDRIWVSQAHAETQASAMTLTVPTTFGNPVQILCGNDAAEPPTALATAATISTTGANSIAINGNGYFYGLAFSAGSGASAANINVHNATTIAAPVFDTCKFRLAGTSSTSRVTFGGASLNNPLRIVLKGCGFKFGATTQRVQNRQADLVIEGFAWESGGSTPASIFVPSATGGIVRASGFDISALAATVNLIENPGSGAAGTSLFYFDGVKVPASWTGGMFSAAPSYSGLRGEMYYYDSGNTNYKFWVEDSSGSVKNETTIVHTGGRTDGTTQLTWIMAGGANCAYPSQPLVSHEQMFWNDGTGSAKTLTANFIINAANKLTDAEIGISAKYFGTSGVPLSSSINDLKASVIATAADQTTNSEAWDSLVTARANLQLYNVGDVIKVASNPGRVFFCTTQGTTGVSEAAGFASAVDGGSVTDATAVFRAGWRQQCDVTLTPQVKGPIKWRVELYKNASVYVDARSASTVSPQFETGSGVGVEIVTAAAGGGGIRLAGHGGLAA